MKQALQDYVKVGLVHFMAYPQCMGGEGPVLETVSKLAQDDFFELLEITRVNRADTRAQVRSAAAQAEMELSFGAQPILLGGRLDLNHEDDCERAKAVDAVKEGIDQAADLGCRSLAVLSGKTSADKDAATQRLLASLKTLCAYGLSKGVDVLLETFDQVAFGKNCLIGPTRDAVEVSQEMRREFPRFGLILDLSHLPLLSETPEHALKAAADHLVHVHIGNCAMDDPAHEAYGDNHPRFGAPGTRVGVPELTGFLRVLLDIGYLNEDRRATVSFEVKPLQGESSELILAGSKRALREAWREV